ncbi:hypothetical protein E4U60_004089 [Claviceps pazoutovae]|uniref:Uncharacterized protein n=1 Tax=Claviceps pazoutovae TaxID=1649127 RepID=A0A9P7SJB3_9HYPO|nr:hypothetical protein E4U60_004089 [Claviceps pazoutovae]
MHPPPRRGQDSGPPLPAHHRGFHNDDDYDYGFDYRASARGSGGRYDRSRSVQPLPPPAYIAYDTQRRPSEPVDHVKHRRGRHPTREPIYSNLRDGPGHGTSAVSPPARGYDDLPRARPHSPYYSQGRLHTHDRHERRDRPSAPAPAPPSRHVREARSDTRSSRSKSVPSASHPERSRENTGTPWWQNPIVRACAVTALTTGLSAALDTRGDPGKWNGAKGAKVAVATVGAAVVDGFLGQKHPDGLRHKAMKKGMEAAMNEAEKKMHKGGDATGEAKEDDRRSRSTRRHAPTHHHGDGRRHRSHDGGDRRRRVY